MVRRPDRKVCKTCHDRQRAIAEGPGIFGEHVALQGLDSEPLEEIVEEVFQTCRHCGEPSDIPGRYCFRCRLHIAKQARDATRFLSDKLDRVPAMRGASRSYTQGSRSHVLDIIKRSRRRRSSRPFTPSTKYSG